MSVVQSAISSIRRKAGEIFNDDQGWFRGGKFTPVQQVQQMGQNLSAWGNIANQGIKNQIDIQKRDFNQYTWQPLKENPVLAPTLNRFEQATPAIGNQLKQLNPFAQKQTPQQNWQDTKKIGAAALTAYGLAKAPLSAVLGGAIINPLIKLGTNVYENKKGADLNKQLSQYGQSRTDVPLFAQQTPYQNKPITQGVPESIFEGAGQGLANAGTTRLTNSLVGYFSSSVPFLNKLTEKAISSGAPVATDTIKEATQKFFNTAGKRLIKAAVLETAVESPIWATFTQSEQETYLEALQREAIQNLQMNVGMAGVQSLGDARSLIPIVKNSVDTAVNNYFKNVSSPENLKRQAGYIDFMGNVVDGTDRTNRFNNLVDTYYSTKSTPQQKIESLAEIKRLATDVFGNKKIQSLSTGLNEDPENLIMALSDVLNKDIPNNTGYQEPFTLRNFLANKELQRGGMDLTDKTKGFPQTPDQPIKTGGDESQIKNIQDELIKLKTEQSKIQTENQINANSLNEMGSPMTKDQINRSNLIQDKIDKLQSQISPESVSKVEGGINNKTFIHETNASNIDKFDTNHIGSGQGDGWLGRGVYFNEKGSFKLEKYGKNEIETSLKPEAKIFEVKETPNGKWRDSFVEWFAKKNPDFEKSLEPWQNPKNVLPRDLLMNKTADDEIIKQLRKEGYDGLFQDGELVVYNPNVVKINKNLSPESKGIKTDLETKLPEQKLPWEEPEYVAKNNGLKTKDSPVLKTGTLKQELNQLQTKASLKSQPIISPELKADIQKGSLAKKVNLIDWFRTPDRVLTKIGLGNEAKQIRTSYNKYLDELPVEISKVTKWYDQVKSSPDASKRLFQYLDGQDVQLNKTELKVAGEIKNYLNDWANKLNLPEDKRVTNYITHIFEKDFIKKEFDEDLAKIISEKVPGSVYDPFTQERLGKAGYVEDVFRALDAYVKRGVRKVNMDPALEKLSSASDKLPLESWKYVKSFADRVNLRPTQIDTYIDDLVKQSPIGYKLGQRPVTATTRKLRQMVYRGTLGLNVGSALRNLTQGVNTYAKLGEKYTAIGYMRNLKEMASGGDELKRVGILRDDLIQDRQLSAVKGVMEKLDKGLFVFFNLAEKINRGSAYFGAKSKYLSEGLSEKEAIEKAVDLVRKTQFTFGSVDTPVAMQSDIAKTLGQFQSFNLKQAEFLGEMIGGKDIAGMIRWVAGNALMMFTVGQLIGIDLKDIIPFGGVFTGETKLGQTPPIQLGTDIYNAAINAPDKYGNTSEDNVLKRVSGAVVKDLPAWIPAGVQAKKTIQGIQAVGQEGSFSKSGRLQYPIEKTTGNYIRAGLFGKSNLPAAKEYFDNNGQVLGEKQTELYKQSSDKQGVYKQIQEERKTTNELEAQKKEFENTGTQSKQVGDKILYLNENNNVSTLDLSKYDDIASLPSDNKYNSAIKESKQYSEAAKIMDNTALTQEQQQTALDRLGIDSDKASYYRIANDSDNLKTMFVLDAVNNVKTQGGGLSDVIQLLANQRSEINGKMIASNGVLDNLVDEGIITKSQATQLKKYKFENGQLTPKSKTGTKAKKVSVTLRKMSAPKLSSSKIKRIKVPKKTYKKLKVRKLRV